MSNGRTSRGGRIDAAPSPTLLLEKLLFDTDGALTLEHSGNKYLALSHLFCAVAASVSVMKLLVENALGLGMMRPFPLHSSSIVSSLRTGYQESPERRRFRQRTTGTGGGLEWEPGHNNGRETKQVSTSTPSSIAPR